MGVVGIAELRVPVCALQDAGKDTLIIAQQDPCVETMRGDPKLELPA